MSAQKPAGTRRGPAATWLIGGLIVLVLLVAWWLSLRAFRATTEVPITPMPAGEAAGKYQEPDAVPLIGGHHH